MTNAKTGHASALTEKQEKFCQKYIELGNASEAYRQSYNCENMKQASVHRMACELMDNLKVASRINELKEASLERHNITVDSLLEELEEARILASTAETAQASAMIKATMSKAELLGLNKADGLVSDNVQPAKVEIGVESARKR